MLLETVTGKLIDVENPTSEMIDIEDIAWALSRIPRFGAHTITEIPYTVAQHSIFVANEVESILTNRTMINRILVTTEQRLSATEEKIIDEFQNAPSQLVLKALLHDAAESYIGDIPSPVKRIAELRPVIKKIEHQLMDVIFTAFGLSKMTDFEEQLIKHADLVAQRIEAHAFMQSRGNHWPGLPSVSLERLQQFQPPEPSLESYKHFMKKYNEFNQRFINNLRSEHSNCA